MKNGISIKSVENGYLVEIGDTAYVYESFIDLQKFLNENCDTIEKINTIINQSKHMGSHVMLDAEKIEGWYKTHIAENTAKPTWVNPLTTNNTAIKYDYR